MTYLGEMTENKPPGYIFEELADMNTDLINELIETFQWRRRYYELKCLAEDRDWHTLIPFWEHKNEELKGLQFHKIHDAYSRQDRVQVMKEEYEETIQERRQYQDWIQNLNERMGGWSPECEK